MADFFTHNAAAVLALVGVLAGGGLSFLIAWVMRRRDFDFKIREKVLERRFTAHEYVVDLALGMRVMESLGEVESSGEPARAPQVMMSKEALDNWLVELAQKSRPATTWLSTPVKRELNFVQDYFVTLYTKLSAVPSANFAIVGSLVRQDFIDLSSGLEKAAFQYFKDEVRELRLNDLADHHKYPLQETKARLQKTVLLGRWAEIEAVCIPGNNGSQ